MSDTFQDRLNRIDRGNTNAIDMIGQGNAGSRPPLEEVVKPEPKTFDQRRKAAIWTNLAFGVAWMFAAVFALMNYAVIGAYIESIPMLAQDTGTYLTMIVILCVGSILGMAWWVFHPVFMDDSIGSPPISLTIGSAAGAILALGPVQFFTNVLYIILEI